MSSGRNNKLTGQTGEYLVAAELARRNLIATTFTGNVPHYDIVASSEDGKHVSVQVKTSRHPTWQLSSISQYCEVTFEGHKQIVGEMREPPVYRLVMVFVRVEPDRNDRFYLLDWTRFRDLIVDCHRQYLSRHDGVRPKRWDSLHVAVGEKNLLPFANDWEVVTRNLH